MISGGIAISIAVIEIPLPSSFTYKKVNSYLIKEDPITLVDPGPISEVSNNYLKWWLENHKIYFSDIKRILITHGHVDHYGFAGIMREKYLTEVFIHNNDLEKVILNTQQKLELKKNTFCNLLQQLQFPQELFKNLDIFFSNFYQFGNTITEPTTFSDNQIIPFEKSQIKAIHLPGHTSGSSGFLYKDSLITGDTILDEVFVTPVLEFDSNGKSCRNFSNYFATLNKLKNFIQSDIYPGHGIRNFSVSEKIDSHLNYITRKGLEISSRYQPSLTIKENFENFYGKDSKNFFFHFSFFYGLLEFVEDNKSKFMEEQNVKEEY